MALSPFHHGVRSVSSCLARYRWSYDVPKLGGGHQGGGGALVEGDVGRVGCGALSRC